MMQLNRLSNVAVRTSSVLSPRLVQSSLLHLRYVSSTIPRLASELPGIPDRATIERLKSTSLYQKLSGNPDAIAAIQKFAEIMSRQGIDTTSGKPPSLVQMSKLFLNSEVREAAKILAEEFKKAGIDLNGKEMMEEMSAFMKKGGDSKK